MKKTYIYSRLAFILMITATVLSSCLKDKDYDNGSVRGSGNTEGKEWMSIPVAINQPNNLGLESKNGAQPISLFSASYDYVDPASSDINAILVLNNALIAAVDPTLVILPASVYTIPSLSMTVKAGKRISDPFVLNINTSTLDPNKKYAIAFTLTSVSKTGVSIPANLKNVIYAFSIKNKYDAIYTFKGKYDWPGDRPASWLSTPFTYPYDVELRTTGPNSVTFWNQAFDFTFLPLMAPGATGFGATGMNIEFDASDKVVSVVNPAPDSRNRNFNLIPGGNSRYDPALKTVFLEINFTQNGTIPTPMHIQLVYKSKRP